MAIIRQNEPAKRPSFEAQMVISSFLTDLAAKIRMAKFKEHQSRAIAAFGAKDKFTDK